MLNSLTKKALTEAIHRNFHSLLHIMCRHTKGFEWVKHADVTYMTCDIPTSIYNRVVSTQFDAADADTRIKEVSDLYTSRGLPFLWMLGPKDSPGDLPRRLERSGFIGSGSPGMAIDLRKLKAPASPPGFRIERVRDEGSLMRYSELMPSAFGFDDYSRKAVTRWIKGVGLRENLRHYLGYHGDRPVASSSVLLADGVAGLYCVASIPEVRGKGVGSLMSTIPLLGACDEGYNVGVLHSTSMAHGVYRGLGFKDYCEIINYSHELGDSYLQTLSRQR